MNNRWETGIGSISDSKVESIRQAVTYLTEGEVVGLPTETVYGLAADATRPEAVLKIFEAKERPFFDPLIVHLPDQEWLEKLAIIPTGDRALVKRLTERYWPGPLTLVLPRAEIVPDMVTSGLPTVALRRSAHPIFKEVIQNFGKPLAAPSANRFGRISPTNATHVFSELNGRIPWIVDGGPTQIGVESTILKIADESMEILRSGPVTREELASMGRLKESASTAIPSAPGQLESHYAPSTPLYLVNKAENFIRKEGVRYGLLAWDSDGEHYVCVEHLSVKKNINQAALNLFSAMRRLDEAGLDAIVAESVPEQGIGAAIMDRLRKAAVNV